MKEQIGYHLDQPKFKFSIGDLKFVDKYLFITDLNFGIFVAKLGVRNDQVYTDS